jgi:hypothetical protein
MRIVSTADVPLPELRRLAVALNPELDAEVDESQIYLRSADPPSWVTLLANANWWTQLLSAYAALYVSELVKEAAKETWRNRAVAIGLAHGASDRLRKMAGAIAEFRRKVSAPTTLGIGLPVPSEYFSTRLALVGESVEDLTAELALFVHHLPVLSQLISEFGLAEGGPATGVFLRLRDDGALVVSWHDRETLQLREHILPVPDPPLAAPD